MTKEETAYPSGADDPITTLARGIAARMLASVGDEWENYPEIGEYDWARVCEAVVGMVKSPSPDEFWTAYEALQERAEP